MARIPCPPGCTCGRHSKQKCPPGCDCARHKPASKKRRKQISEARTKLFFENQKQDDPELKRCTRCGEFKRVRPKEESEFRWRKVYIKALDGYKEYPISRCRPCDNAAKLERDHEKRKTGELQARRKRAREKRKQDPERYRKHLEYQREWSASKRREQGITPRGMQNGDEKSRIFVDAKPFRDYLRPWIEKQGFSTMAITLDVDESAVRRWMNEDIQSSVELDTVDHVLVRMGDSDQLNILYPVATSSSH